MLTKPSPPKLIESVTELVDQTEIGFFIETGARNENYGKDYPPENELRFVTILCIYIVQAHNTYT